MEEADQQNHLFADPLLCKPGNHVRVVSDDGLLCMAEVISVDSDGCLICSTENEQLKVSFGDVQPGCNVVSSTLNSHLDAATRSSDTSAAGDSSASSSSCSSMALPCPSTGMFVQDAEGHIWLLQQQAADGTWQALECASIASVLPTGSGQWPACHYVITDKQRQLEVEAALKVVSIRPRMLYRSGLDKGYYEVDHGHDNTEFCSATHHHPYS